MKQCKARGTELVLCRRNNAAIPCQDGKASLTPHIFFFLAWTKAEYFEKVPSTNYTRLWSLPISFS